MKATTVGLAGSLVPAGLAPGHVGGRRVPNRTFQACAPAGALRSSTRDMARLLAACLAGEKAPLHAAITMTMQRQHANEEMGGGVGLGWMLTETAERPVVWHNGATAGSHAFYGFSPTTGAGILILANVQKGAEALGFALLGAKPAVPVRAALKNAADFVGRYPLVPGLLIDVTETSDEFFLKVVEARVRFTRDAAGRVDGLVLRQGGRDLPAKRKQLGGRTQREGRLRDCAARREAVA